MKKVMIAVGKLTGGGAERVATVWANQLEAAGCEVSILTLFKADDEYVVKGGVTVHRIAEDRSAFSQMTTIQRFHAFRQIIHNERPEYIISFLPYVQTWVMLTTFGLKVKRIDTVRNNLLKEQFPNVLQKLLWKLCYVTCSGIILQSSDQAMFLTKKQRKKCVVIPNPVSDVYLRSCKDEIAAPLMKFMAAGRIHDQKNYPMMIKGFARACRKFPELTLSIYGAGKTEYTDYIKGLISEEGMNEHIFLQGRVSNIEQEYRKQDVFLMTSDYEGMPNALAEAMASKLICISTDCMTGPRDLIDDGINGFLTPVGDEDALQRTIEHVLELPREKAEQIAIKAREKILTYCAEENSVQRLLSMLK